MWITLCGYVDNYVKLFVLLCFGVWINCDVVLITFIRSVDIVDKMLITLLITTNRTRKHKVILCTIYRTCFVGLVDGILAENSTIYNIK